MPGPIGLVRNAIAVRLAVMFGVAALAVFALLGLALHEVLQHEQADRQYEAVQRRMEDVRFLLVESVSSRLAQFLRQKINVISREDSTIRFWMWSADTAYRYGDGAEQIARQFQQPGQERMIDLAPDTGRPAMLVVGVALPANDIRPAVVLMVGISKVPFTHTLHTLDLSLVLCALVGTVLASVLGYWIVRVGLQPLARMSADAQSIGPDNRGQRLALAPLPRELLNLGQSFNAALDRLDSAYQKLETFNADVAHELRTPLSNLIGQTQVTLARQRDAAALREVLQSNLEELERLSAIVADMLFLARAEQGERVHLRTQASIAAEVGKTIEFFDVLLEEARMRVSVQGDAVAPIETALFRRALSNLLQNAIQHSAPGGDIQVRITREADSATVAFSNPGRPIAPEHLARLFDRFFRLDAARSNSYESHGLGLAIVKAVAVMHDGKVFASAQDGIVTVGFSVALQGQWSCDEHCERTTEHGSHAQPNA